MRRCFSAARLASVANPASPRDLARLAPKVGLDIVEERRQPAVVSSRGHEPVCHDHLMAGINRDLAVVALHEAIAGRQDPASGSVKFFCARSGGSAAERYV